MSIRNPDFAGAWYPSDNRECLLAIEAFLSGPPSPPHAGAGLHGGIVPHAGWVFSGRAAARTLHRLASAVPAPDVAILFGGHLGPRHPHTLMAEGAWRTPLGDLPVASWLADALADEFAFDIETPSRHRPDNTLELQMPFIRHFWPDVEVLGIQAAPRPEALAIASRAMAVATSRGKKPVVIGSTDLTHYGPNYGFMPQGTGPGAVDWVRNDNDRRLVDCILRLDPEALIREALRSHNACCPGAAASALAAGRALGATEGTVVDYYTSHDIRPDDSFVGYVGAVF